MRKIILVAVLCLGFVGSLSIAGPVVGGGGGDTCENQIQIVSSDLMSWIVHAGSQYLKLPQNVTLNQYNQTMVEQIKITKVNCVGKGDQGYPVNYQGTPKICVFNFNSVSGSKITCDFEKFNQISIDDQYVLIHHEYAGLSGIENPSEDVSNYQVSNQIAAFLEEQTTKKLVVKKPVHKMIETRTQEYICGEAPNTFKKTYEITMNYDSKTWDFQIHTPGNPFYTGSLDAGVVIIKDLDSNKEYYGDGEVNDRYKYARVLNYDASIGGIISPDQMLEKFSNIGYPAIPAIAGYTYGYSELVYLKKLDGTLDSNKLLDFFIYNENGFINNGIVDIAGNIFIRIVGESKDSPYCHPKIK